MKIFVLGCPSPGKVGGANGEMLGAVFLWLKHGLEVGVIPTWNGPGKQITDQLEGMGCSVHLPGPRLLHTIEGFAGSTVVTFCNDNAFMAKRQLAKLGCRFIVAPLMCFLRQTVTGALRERLISDIIFQSEYQKSVLLPQVQRYGLDKFHLVRGYIDWEKIKFAPRSHAKGEPFIIGRASRGRASKWSKHWWKMYEEVPDRQAILLGVTQETTRQIGRAPSWAKASPPGAVPIESFWPQLHAHVTCNDMDMENWPRTGLECMAYGVPTCAENRGGWTEMLEHEVTGMLGNSPQDIGRQAAKLARDEDLRMAITTEARRRLETDISNPDLVWEQWREVFGLPCDVTYGVSSASVDQNEPLRGQSRSKTWFDEASVYGISPIQQALPICRDMQILQDAADQVEEPEVQEEPLPLEQATLPPILIPDYDFDDPEDPHPMPCFQHGGSSACEELNAEHEMTCPKCPQDTR
jgi:hypothetical protein